MFLIKTKISLLINEGIEDDCMISVISKMYYFTAAVFQSRTSSHYSILRFKRIY